MTTGIARKKKFVIASDSFKACLTAKQACDAFELGIMQIYPDSIIVKVPMADGGEGTVQALVDATGGRKVAKVVTGPLGTPVTAEYGILGDGKTGVIEMASASGIEYLKESEKNPLVTTTFGTGELIKDCLDHQISKIIIGIGGSATNDGGCGMASALGVRFLDKNGLELPRGGGGLRDLDRIDTTELDPRVKNSQLIIASDVLIPLYGINGASEMFGPQKGADDATVKLLDNYLKHYGDVIQRDLGKDVALRPGAGAAGGLGAGLFSIFEYSLRSGVDIIIEYTDLEKKLVDADYCFTGEGRIDFQTEFGKTPYGVAKMAKSVNSRITVIGVSGSIGKNISNLYTNAFDAIFSITPGPSDLETLLQDGQENIIKACENICRLIKSVEFAKN